jgi:hypothetical protein
MNEAALFLSEETSKEVNTTKIGFIVSDINRYAKMLDEAIARDVVGYCKETGNELYAVSYTNGWKVLKLAGDDNFTYRVVSPMHGKSDRCMLRGTKTYELFLTVAVRP